MLVHKLRALDAIAAKLRKSPEGVRKKIDRLGLEVVDLEGLRTTTSLKIQKELPSGAHVFPQIRFSNRSTFRSRLQAMFLISQARNHHEKKNPFFPKTPS
jgi:hypothetical protein